MGKVDLIGKRFEKLVVIAETNKRGKNGGIIWKCKCDCGNYKEINSQNLKNGHIKSCGCLHKETAKKLGEKTGNINVKKAIVAMNQFNIEDTNVKKITGNKYKNNKSGFVGVFWMKNKNKWCSFITVNKKRTHLGYFICIEDAIQARKDAENKYFHPIIEKFEKTKER